MENKKISKYIFRLFSVMIFALLLSFIVTSSIFARYLSGDSSGDQARVAKWDIDFNDGTSFNSIINSTHLESGSSGAWGLDITNKSEVLAKFNDDSNLKIRLQSPDFHLDHEHNSWDFLVDNEHNHIDNPINFKAYMYNCSLAELEALNGDMSGIEVVEIFDTKNNSSELDFHMHIDQGELYFDCVVNIGKKLNVNDKFLLENGSGKACLKIFWQVDKMMDAVSTNDTFKSYVLVEESQYSKTKYDGKTENLISIGSKHYVIAYNLHDYFEYLIYTSSLGGEVMVTFTDSLGKDYVRRCTKLSDVEKNSLLARTANVNTIDEANRYLELLEYQEFNKFLQIQSNYSKTTGYLSLGLECRIILDLRIEQNL